MLTNISTYRSDFNETKYMSFFTKDNGLLEKYRKIWDKVSKKNLIVSL